MEIVVKIQSLSDIITNSSTEIYTKVSYNGINYLKSIINSVLKASGSESTCDDLFEITIDNQDLYERYGEYICDKIYKYPNPVLKRMLSDWQHDPSEKNIIRLSDEFYKHSGETIEDYKESYDNRGYNTDFKVISKGNPDEIIMRNLNNVFDHEVVYD